MTISEAREILEKSEEVAPSTDEEGRIYYTFIGDYYHTLLDGSHGFITYPYTSEIPVDMSYAFVCYVDKNTGYVGCATAPLPKEELEEFYERKKSGKISKI